MRIDLLTDEIKKLREENDMLRKSNAETIELSTNASDVVVRKEPSEESKLLSSVHQLSISSLTVPECKPLTEGEGIDRHSFEMWRDLLRGYEIVGNS